MCWWVYMRSVYEISCSLQRHWRAMPYLFQSHIPEQLRLRVFNCCNVMWKAYGSFTPSDRGDDGLCRTIGEFQYINQLKFSRRRLYWLSQSDYWSSAGPNFYWLKVLGVKNDFVYRRCGGGKSYASNMLPRSKQKNVCNLPQFGKIQTV